MARLMRCAGLRGRAPRRKTTVPDPAAAARADLIRRDFSVNAAGVNSRWCGDITYIPTWEGWLYLATVIDMASRRVVGFALAEQRRIELAGDALTNAVAARDPAPGVVFHSDKGLPVHQRRLRHPRRRSRGLPVDGPHRPVLGQRARRVVLHLPERRVPRPPALATRAAACHATVEYIAWFNGTRLHSALGYITPEEFETATDEEVVRQVA